MVGALHCAVTGYYRLIQTPRDRTMGGCALTPALSDANWETVWEVTLGWAAGAYVHTLAPSAGVRRSPALRPTQAYRSQVLEE